MLTGFVEIGGHRWLAREERRHGPRSQIFILTAEQTPGCEMHVRPMPDTAVQSLEEVQVSAANATVRWFVDADGVRWEARLVVHTNERGMDEHLVKFISGRREVHEGPYEHRDGLGVRTDEELVALLKAVAGKPAASS